jgi:hypothetical protein
LSLVGAGCGENPLPEPRRAAARRWCLRATLRIPPWAPIWNSISRSAIKLNKKEKNMENEKKINKKIEDNLKEKEVRESDEFFEEQKKLKIEKQEELKKITEEKLEEHQNAEKKEEDIRQEIKTMLDEDENKQIIFEKRRDLYKAKKESETALTEYLLAAVKSDPELAEKYGLTKEDRRKLEPAKLLEKAVEGRRKLFDE